ncbi:hypothetical protein GKZ27_07430 [Enterorhabdus mucosicola]|uniref:Uncharacterized protein n=1 Tax=Adlercreutzia mucosicola TaxID=580026 RepID=A0A6N8JQ87_9ACTN|nr:hypothetical protein [Adlercreutzia mucosicola]MVX61284.1 hypothetical protein [Adlercreutzia mucosicola]
MDKIIKALVGLIFAFILLVGVFGILPQLGLGNPFANFENPLAGLFEQGKNTVANAALDASGLKSKANEALKSNRDRIAEVTGLSRSQVDDAIDALDIESWEVTSLPASASKTGSTDISYGGTDATITTYDDPSVVTVNAMGQDVTLAVPDSAQSYLPFLGYLG